MRSMSAWVSLPGGGVSQLTSAITSRPAGTPKTPTWTLLAATVLNPKRLGNPDEYANLAMTMIQNGYFNGEDVRLDGSIRMAPR